MKIRTKLLALLALWCTFAAPLNVLAYSWGLERGRANEGDAARLLVDQIAMKRAKTRIGEAVTRPLVVERQRQLLGLPDSGAKIADLMDDVFNWWLTDVMQPAEDIATNPAASCAEAQVALQELLGIMRQRQLLGMSPAEDDKSAGAEKARDRDGELWEMYQKIGATLETRCHEEALDECVVTGRFSQIIQNEFASNRDKELLGFETAIDFNWIDDALKQCAIYELHFVSTTKAAQIFNVETVRDGKIKLEFELVNGALAAILNGNKTLGDLLKGETKGAENPFLVSVKCSQPPLEVVCSPGSTADPVTSHVNELELKHREFYVDNDGRSRERTLGEDKFSFEFARGIYALEAFIKVPNYGNVKLPFEALGFAFYIAHKKDRFPEGYRDTPAVKVENNKRGTYPVLFSFTYADQNTDGASASDSTVFELIHKPKPEDIKRAPEKQRTPLKPRKKSGG